MKQKIREHGLDENWFQSELKRAASKLAPLIDDQATEADKWRRWLRDGTKSKFDLYLELGAAPFPMKYIPGPAQLAYHTADEKVKQVAGGWRAGKSKSMAAEMLPFAFIDKAEIWIVAPDYSLAQAEFKYMYEWLVWLGVKFDDKVASVSMPLNGKWTMRLPWEATIETKSAEDVRKIEMGNCDIAGVAEAGLVEEAAIYKLRGRTLEKGGHILLNGSLDASQWWYLEKFQEHLNGSEDGSWRSFSIPSWDNLIIFPGGRNDPKIKAEEAACPPDLFDLKFAAVVAKPQELVFTEFNEADHVVPIEWAEATPSGIPLDYPHPIMDDVGYKVIKWLLPARSNMEVAVDPGMGESAYAVLFVQKFGDQIFVLDEVYAHGLVVHDIIRECRSMSWWPYVKSGVIDIGGTQHHQNKSQQEIWAEPNNGGIFLRSSFVPISDGITRLKTFLRDPLSRRPKIWISPRCRHFIKEFSKYKYRVSKENRSVREEPIDRYNHAIKAITYYLADRFGLHTISGDRRVVAEKYIKSAKLPWHEGGEITGFNPLQDPYS